MSADNPPKIDVRALSLTQLQRLVAHGSRRARAELEHRMAEADARAPSRGPAENARAAAPVVNVAAVDQPRAARPAPTAPVPLPAVTTKPRLVTAASLDEMAAQAQAAASAAAAGGAPGMRFPGNHAAPPAASQAAEVLRLQALARQEEARQRAEGPPGLIGMALMAWGTLVLFGGLVLLTRTGGLYYMLFGLACAGVGWLLFRCKRMAIWAQAACVVVAFVWAWRGYAGSNLLTALIQSAPVWVPAFWIAVPPVREPLD